MANPPFKVNNAAITTATVEVRTLTVSGKQVTLAVFRQLREEEVVTEDGKLAGTPWGFVNYHPNKCGTLPEHLHVVWQKGDELRRATVYSDKVFPVWTPPVGGRLLSSAVLDIATSGASIAASDADALLGWVSFGVVHFEEWVDLKPSRAAMNVARYLAYWRQSCCGPEGPGGDSSSRAGVDKNLPALEAEVAGFGAGTQSLLAELYRGMRAEQARRERHHDVRRLITELPHLFIAV